ncbi:MAG: hypothetical protein KKB74_11770 [Bacteroidetes bacterium]|nr:hypothetical protein [Bacteroidota bacterium]
MENFILYFIPVGITLYFYFLPKVLIYAYVDKYIETNFDKYTENHSDTVEIKKNIYGITGLMSFLSFIGGVFVGVIGDTSFLWNQWYIIGVICFVGFALLILLFNFRDSLKLSKGLKAIEVIGVLIFLIAILINVYIR